MKILNFACAAVLVSSSLSSIGQKFEGDWIGKILVQGFPLTIEFHISKQNTDFTATMDSPDQKSFGNKITEVLAKGNTIDLNEPQFKMYTKLSYRNDSLIGVFKQLGTDYPLSMCRKTDQNSSSSRPQEPKSPFDYDIEEVKFKNTKDNINLAGTFTCPKGTGPFPTVILISGSGGQNRNEEIFNHKPFWVIADYFAKNGIATLRYDDRGIEESEGNFASATSADFANDARAGIEFLKQHSKVDKQNLGIVGHSEGGMIAPMIAASDNSIGFLILLAAPGIPIDQLMILQNNAISKASMMSESTMAKNQKLNQQCYQILKAEKSEKDTKSQLKKLFKSKNMSEAEIESLLAQITSPWFKYFISYDPKYSLEKVFCPVLALNGDKDVQVTAKENLAGIAASLEKGGNKEYETKLIENKNHLFQTTTKYSLDEYVKNDESFAPDVLNLMANWIKKIQEN